ncbi:MAG: monovalent cation/H+ antiporter subunit D, partial [Shimia sp.]|nr:monovalent cation/H+ antiporter subunit D [Shimia sp.]
LMVMDGVRDQTWMALAWGSILIASLVTIVGFARAGSVLFWKATSLTVETPSEDGRPATILQIGPSVCAIGALAALSVFAGPTSAYLESAAAQLFDNTDYINAVLYPALEGLK